MGVRGMSRMPSLSSPAQVLTSAISLALTLLPLWRLFVVCMRSRSFPGCSPNSRCCCLPGKSIVANDVKNCRPYTTKNPSKDSVTKQTVRLAIKFEELDESDLSAEVSPGVSAKTSALGSFADSLELASLGPCADASPLSLPLLHQRVLAPPGHEESAASMLFTTGRLKIRAGIPAWFIKVFIGQSAQA